MTERLYDFDSYLKEFTAEVVSCTPRPDGNFNVILNKTAFFPEEGGQCCDTGFLNDTAVTYVSISEDGIITHVTDKELSGLVIGKIDFDKRFRNMQNHTGEHILSGIIHKNFGFNNVGFHLGETDITMDIDGVLSPEELNEIEFLANKVVVSNVEVTACYPDSETLKSLDYRSKKEIDGDIRIVTIKGVDDCACCAPHVKTTGEIGIIKILEAVKMRGGLRLNIKCGFDALNDYNEKYRNVKEISRLLKSPQTDTSKAVEALLEETKELKFKIGELKRTLIFLRAEKVDFTDGNLCIFEDDMSSEELRLLANAVKEKCGGVCAVMSQNSQNGYSYCLASENVDLKENSALINKELNGIGGGQKSMIFGNFLAEKQTIIKFFEESKF